MGKWWVTFCDRCGRWAQARPAMPWWEKREDEVEVDEDEFRKLRRSSGYVRAWYIGDQVTRLVNEHRCN
jgi:hypothetical protein